MAHSLSNLLFYFFFTRGCDDENGHDLFFFGGIFTEANAKAINNAKTIRTCCVEARTMNYVTSSQASLLIHDTGMKDLVNDQLR